MRLRLRRHAFAAVVLAASALSAPAATLSVDGFYMLGDSLSDVGNAHRLSLGQVPESPPYDRLRFSNGRIWYDRVAAAVRADGGRTRNFAYGGAQARTNRDPIPDLSAQRRLLLNKVRPGRDDLLGIWMGGNDLLRDPGDKKVARKAADAVYSNARSLQRAGFDSALIFNLPNLADIPRYLNSDASRRRAVKRASGAYNDRLADHVTSLRGRGMEVIEVDVFKLFADVIANPSSYGLENMTKPCIRGGRDRCSAAEARVAGFADAIHPSAALHAILGRHVLGLLETPSAVATRVDAPLPAGTHTSAAVAAVPLPAPALLLLTAIAGIAFTTRGRRRAGSLGTLAG